MLSKKEAKAFIKSRQTDKDKDVPIYKQIREAIDRAEVTKYPELESCPISELVGKLIAAVGIGHILHLNTVNWETHKWLDVFYKDMPEKIDAFAEAVIGTWGSTIPVQTLSSEACGCPYVLIAELLDACKAVHPKLQDAAIIAPLEEIMSFLSKMRYLSRLQ